MNILKERIPLKEIIKDYEYDKIYNLFKTFPHVEYQKLIIDISNCGGRNNNKLLYLDISSKIDYSNSRSKYNQYSYDYYTNNWEKI